MYKNLSEAFFSLDLYSGYFNVDNSVSIYYNMSRDTRYPKMLYERQAKAHAQSDQSLCLSLEYSRALSY